MKQYFEGEMFYFINDSRAWELINKSIVLLVTVEVIVFIFDEGNQIVACTCTGSTVMFNGNTHVNKSKH